MCFFGLKHHIHLFKFKIVVQKKERKITFYKDYICFN